MIVSQADLVSSAMRVLPADLRLLVESYYFDDDSIRRIQRRSKQKRRDLELLMDSALRKLRIYMSEIGVRSIQDVI